MKNTPYSHWIMMGHHGDGLYNSTDYDFTRGFTDTQMRNKAIEKEISRTVDELGYSGLFKLYSTKSARDFGDGTYGLSDFLDEPHEKNTSIHKYVLYDGEKYSKYTHYCTSLQIALFCIVLFGVYSVFTGRRKSGQKELAPFVAMFGIIIFLMLWETNRRYFSNFVPMIFVCTVLSVDYAVEIINEKYEAVKAVFRQKH